METEHKSSEVSSQKVSVKDFSMSPIGTLGETVC